MSDTCERCGLPFFTTHSPQNCIDALKVKVVQLEEAAQRDATWRMKFVSQILAVNAPKPPPIIEESLDIAHQRGGWD